VTNRDPRRIVRAWAPAVLVLAAVAWSCRGSGKTATPTGEAGTPPAPPAAGSSANPLVGTEWRLVEFQSMDDAVGTVRASDPSLYTMRLGADGTVNMRLNCNRANGSWKATPSADPSTGQFEFSSLAGTRASCPPPSMDERVTAQAAYVRSYLLKDGRLYLSLMADGGIFAWEPITEVPVEATPDAVLEAAILTASPSYTKDVVGAGDGPAPGRYVYSRVDLNGDGRDEVMVYLMGSFFCGTGGCTLQLFAESQNGYALVSEFPLGRTPVIVASTKTNGWNDLFRLESGGGAETSYVKHVFDGTTYVEHERTRADTAPGGTRCLTGDVTFDKAIPLAPAEKALPGSGISAPPPSERGFSTVCGVTAGGQEYRYTCTVEGVVAGTSGETVLHFPDNTVTLQWLGGGTATATFAGMVPKDITFSTADGVTRFTFEDKVYFFASDRAVAAAQLRTRR
jgi:heat shock protein HslJ